MCLGTLFIRTACLSMLVGLRRERVGITPLHRPPRTQPAIRQQFPRLTRPWFEGGDKGAGKGKDWAERALGWTARIVQHSPKPRHVRVPAEAAIDWAAILPPPGFRGVLPRRWVGKRIFA